MASFKNTLGFRPKGNVLQLWSLLPQISTTIDGEEIPPIFGDIKNVALYYVMVIMLIILEIVLMFNLNDEGVSFIILLGLSFVDFVIAIFPHYKFEKNPFHNHSHLMANIFIRKTNLRVPVKIPADLNGNEERYRSRMNEELDIYKGHLRNTFKIIPTKLQKQYISLCNQYFIL